MTKPAPRPAVPILDASKAADHLLDARLNLTAIKDSTFDGQPLRAAMVTAITAVDSALGMVRAMTGKSA